MFVDTQEELIVWIVRIKAGLYPSFIPHESTDANNGVTTTQTLYMEANIPRQTKPS